MEEEHIIPAENKEPASKASSGNMSAQQKFFIVVAIILVFVIIGGAFWFGSSKKKQESEPSPSPTAESSPTTSPEDEEGIESPSPSPVVTGSPSPTPSPAPVTQEETITATASLDGYRGSNGFGHDDLYILIGRNFSVIQRGFVSFDISSLPSGAVIESATLRMYQQKIVGNPYGVGGSLKIDHLDYGGSLGNEDYSASSISSSFTTLTSNATIEWKDANVTDTLKNDLSNGRNNSQYRIHFSTESTGASSDLVYFESADNSEGTGNLPQLIIKYH